MIPLRLLRNTIRYIVCIALYGGGLFLAFTFGPDTFDTLFDFDVFRDSTVQLINSMSHVLPFVGSLFLLGASAMIVLGTKPYTPAAKGVVSTDVQQITGKQVVNYFVYTICTAIVLFQLTFVLTFLFVYSTPLWGHIEFFLLLWWSLLYALKSGVVLGTIVGMAHVVPIALFNTGTYRPRFVYAHAGLMLVYLCIFFFSALIMNGP